MDQFFYTPDQRMGSTVRLEGEDAAHIGRVLRLRAGDVLRLSDGAGRDSLGVIEAVDKTEVTVRITEDGLPVHELPFAVTLYQGLPKADKLDWIIQKNTELGVSRFVPVAMKYSVPRTDEKKADRKTARRQAVAKAAACQSKRSVIPEVTEPVTFRQMLAEAKDLDMFLVPYENAEGTAHTREVIGRIRPGMRVGILIGPEGGFAPEEAQAAEEAGGVILSLGPRILRTETAGMTLMAAVMLSAGE